MSDQVAEMSATYLVEAARNAVPVRYKQTEVGVIPEDWSCIEIGALKPFITSGSRGWAAFYSAYGAPFVRITNTSRKSIYLDMTNTKFVSISENASEGSRTSLENGDVLISITADIGICSYVDDQIAKPAYINQHIALVRFDTSIINSKFVAYFLSSHKVQKLFRSGSDQGAKAGMNLDGVRRIKLAIPTSSEQTAIANALSDVDALISELEKLIAKKQAIKTATMQQLLTGRTRLPQFALHEDGTPKGYKQSELGEIPDDWDIEEFSNLASPSSSRVNPKLYGGGDFCIELEHINQGDGYLSGFTTTNANSSLKNIFEKDDVLFGKLRAYLKKYWLSNQSGVCSTEIWVLKAKIQKSLSNFIFYLVQTERFIEAASEAYGTHMPRADWKVISVLPIATPRKKEQSAIANILSDMDKEIQALEQRLGKTRQIKQGMMQELLTGKTRLVVPAA